jgi:hypothetical protein
MPVVARKTKPMLRKPPVQRGPRRQQAIPVPASPHLVARKVSPSADAQH